MVNCHTILMGGNIAPIYEISPGSLQDYLNFQWNDADNDLDDY
jgi:hypothetical protein